MFDGASPSICRNHRRYLAMDVALAATRGAIRTHWFAAAACVTHPLRGLGVLDHPLGRLAFSGPQTRFLRFVHCGLFCRNKHWFEQLRRGVTPVEFTGLADRSLDHAMVDAEQRLFGRLTQSYFHSEPYRAPLFLAGLSDQLQRSLVLRSPLVADGLREALRFVRQTGHIDIACEEHRRRIGHHLVDSIRLAREGHTSIAAHSNAEGWPRTHYFH